MSAVPVSLPLPVSDAALAAAQPWDTPPQWEAFSRQDAENPSLWHSSVRIEGMYCAACSLTIEEALRAVSGVQTAQVSAANHRAQISWSDTEAVPSDWIAAVRRAGYRAVPTGLPQADAARQREQRQALWRWLVAGLCMMQVMMYAYPAYTAVDGDLSDEMEQLLRWASWVLTLPVVLFCCAPFFKQALRDLAQRQISMELPVALGMAITFAVSTAGTFAPQGVFGAAVYFDSLTMFVFFLLSGRWLEARFRAKTAGALEALVDRLPAQVLRRSAAGAFEHVGLHQLRVGDWIRVAPGEAFAADGCIEEGETQVDEALLSGESLPLPRSQGEQVVAGSYNLSATVLVRVEKVAKDTRFAQIVALMDGAAHAKPRMAQLADRIARPFLWGVLLAAAGACAWWWPHSPEQALMVAVAVLVVTCPCALSLATPTAMLAAAGKMARSAVLVRRLAALERMARVDTVVFDKTGTLTRDAFVLDSVRLREGCTRGQALGMARALAVHSLHPVARALMRAQDNGLEAWHCDGVRESAGQGLSAEVSMAHTAWTRTLRLGSADFCGVDVPAGDDRLCAHLSDAQGWLATFVFEEDLRADAAQAVQALKDAGIVVQMLSGDGFGAVARVADAAGITSAFGRCTPVDKLARLGGLQQQGRVVAMVGDGINDGPVLAGADVSFAFGRSVPLAQAQADLVVLSEQLMAVPKSLLLARRTMAIVRQNLYWALAYNAACVPLAVVGWMPPWLAGLGMAASSLLVVMNALRLTR